jgi:hypothetical protein
MRQQELSNPSAYDVVEAPALRETKVERLAQPTPAVPDMPKAAGAFMVAAYGGLMAAFALTIHGARADFVIVIGIFYLAMLVGVPAVMFGFEGDRSRRPDLLEFLGRGLKIETGRISGGAALVQMLIVPVLLAFAILAMGITYLLV